MSEDTLGVALNYRNSLKDVIEISHESTYDDGIKISCRISIVICDILAENVINMALFDSSIDRWKVDNVGVKLSAELPVDTSHYSIQQKR